MRVHACPRSGKHTPKSDQHNATPRGNVTTPKRASTSRRQRRLVTATWINSPAQCRRVALFPEGCQRVARLHAPAGVESRTCDSLNRPSESRRFAKEAPNPETPKGRSKAAPNIPAEPGRSGTDRPIFPTRRGFCKSDSCDGGALPNGCRTPASVHPRDTRSMPTPLVSDAPRGALQ
jgi:hypothetical protein